MTTPKIELHLHLEGAAPPTLIRDLAKKRHVNLSGIFDNNGMYAFRDFGQFLKVYEAACTVLRSPEDYHALTLAVLETQAEEGAIYSEVFLCPQFCGGGDVAAWRDYVAAAQDAAALAESRFGVSLRIIATAVRHFGPDAAKRAALCAAETAGEFVTGFGLAGDEGAGRPRDFAWAFDLAREAELGLTAHAGEWGGPSSVRDTVDDLRVSRVGHGVRAVEDPALVERLARDGIVLEVCPGSNVALGVYPSWHAHPVDRLREAGVPVTISTDDPPFFHTSLSREYDLLSDAFGWDADTFAAINRTAVDAAFCDAQTKADLIKRLEPADD
ncbi:adenosine deaminase [Meridianimarinicoccus aquatilis]|uniref:Adenosine deaminase n=1 Tax=Meridianimarinicoccus aquatilis TaxID=2552766 RepID=A0A4R6B256_9RHOB|nr:adenosine deaminase [Fluviibacterium aquatile]TDL90670.1 adenosine deaminase [Fluviibacterium aquatile]